MEKKIKRLQQILDAIHTIVAIGFFAVATYAVYYMVFIKQLWMVVE